MPDRSRACFSAVWVLLWALTSGASGAPEPVTAVLEVEGTTPAAVDALGDPWQLSAVTLDSAGLRAAGVLPAEGQTRRSIVRLVSPGSATPVDLEMPGLARSLLFDRTGETLFVLLHRPAKRGEGESWLVRIDIESLKARKEMRLPASAHALALAGWDDVLLIAADDAVRTVRLPELHSGPLYLVHGEHRAVAALGRSTRVLLGRPQGLVMIDVEDPSGQDGLPERETLALAKTVAQIGLSADGRRGLARLVDGSIVRFRLAPLRLEDDGAPDETPAPRPPPPQPAPPQATPPAQPAAGAEPEPEPQPPPERSATLRGSVDGPAAAEARSVLVLGPDSVIRIAARTEIGADGSWSVSGLPPGRYRIQVQGPDGSQLITDPSFAVVDIEAAVDNDAPTIRVLRAL